VRKVQETIRWNYKGCQLRPGIGNHIRIVIRIQKVSAGLSILSVG
jgi:hypothetical protein